MGQSRIPSAFDEFNTYISTIDSYLKVSESESVTTASRLGISDEEVAAIDEILDEWNELYALYGDKKNSRTATLTAKLHLVHQELVDYNDERHLLDRIAASVDATVTDLNTFNIHSAALVRKSPTTMSTALTEQVTAIFTQLGGGILKVVCETSSNGRAAVPDHATGVQYRYQVGTEAPASAEAATLTQAMSSKARFKLDMGSDNSGKNVYIYFRWYNYRYPAYAGPWSSLESVLLL